MKMKIFDHGFLSWIEDFIGKHPLITALLVWTNPILMILYWIWAIIALITVSIQIKHTTDEFKASYRAMFRGE